MSLETATYISDLNASNPTATDLKSQGDDHIRLLKSAVKATFPNVSAAVTPTHLELNYVAGVTSAVQLQFAALKTSTDNANAYLAPTGMIGMWATITAPSGWLLCNGQAVSRSTYAALFTALGVVFGAGDGSTTFNLPDYRDRTPVGAGTTYAANAKGGSKDAIVVSHSHGVTDPGHSHGYTGTNFSFTGYAGGTAADLSAAKTTDAAATGIAISATGVSGLNANLPPYLGIYFIIKT